MFFRKQCWHLVSVNFGSGECTEISLVWNQLIISSCFETWCPKISSSRSLCKGLSVSCQEWRNLALFHIKSFSYHVTILLKKKTNIWGSQVGHMWVTSRLFCGSVGQIGNRCDPLSTLGHTFYNRPCLATDMLVHTCFYIWLLFTEKCQVWLTIAKQHTVKWGIELI